MNPTIKISALVLTLLTALVISSSSSSAPGPVRQTGAPTSGTAEVIFGIGLPQKSNKRILNFDLNWVNVTHFELSGNPEIQAYAKQLQKDINSGSVDGQVTVKLGWKGLPKGAYTLPVIARLSFGANIQRDRPNRVGRPETKAENSTGLKGSIIFRGFINGSKGFSLEDLSLIPGSRVALRFQDKAGVTTEKGSARTASRGNARSSFRAVATEQAVPGVRFGSLEINVDAWGKTPGSLRDLGNIELSVISGSMQYDEASGTVTGKYTFGIKTSRGV